jgi:hypothetical protein
MIKRDKIKNKKQKRGAGKKKKKKLDICCWKKINFRIGI